MGSACDQVFGTAELLHIILSHLPLKQLAKCERINKQWRAVMLEPGEKEFEQAMWRTSVDDYPVIVWDRAAQHNPRLPWQPTLSRDKSLLGVYNNAAVAAMHPILDFEDQDEMAWPDGISAYLKYDFDEPKDYTSEILRRSFATQPPCLEMTISIYFTNHSLNDIDIQDEKGITIGRIMDAVQEGLEDERSLHVAKLCSSNAKATPLDAERLQYIENMAQAVRVDSAKCMVYHDTIWEGSPWVKGAKGQMGGRLWKGNTVIELGWHRYPGLQRPNFDGDDW